MVDAFNQGKSFKNYQVKIGKVDYLLATQTIKYHRIIETLLDRCAISSENKDATDGEISNNLGVGNGCMKVMIYELLFGKGKISGGGVVKRKLLIHEQQLRDALNQLMRDERKVVHADLLPDTVTQADNLPKFVRINEIKWSIEEGISYFLEKFPGFSKDELIPSLVALPAFVKGLGTNAFVQEGNLIIQDKASCFTSQVLFDEWAQSVKEGDFIDACAAPGNKTSHLAAQLFQYKKNKACSSNTKIFAFDKSNTRAALLHERMKQAGAGDTVHVLNKDFLSADVASDDFCKVTACLVDPSCSGSGVVRSLDRVVQAENLTENSSNAHEERLRKLRRFQIQCIEKAMRFPGVRLIAYSTCSIHAEENESVVEEVLRHQKELSRPMTDPSTDKMVDGNAAYYSLLEEEKEGEEEASAWVLAEPARFTSWSRRGLAYPGLTPVQSQRLIRAAPSDGTNGFFVALFKRNDAYQIDQEATPHDFNKDTSIQKVQNTDTRRRLIKRSVQQMGNSTIDNETKIINSGSNGNKCNSHTNSKTTTSSSSCSSSSYNSISKEPTNTTGGDSLFGGRFRVVKKAKKKR